MPLCSSIFLHKSGLQREELIEKKRKRPCRFWGYEIFDLASELKSSTHWRWCFCMRSETTRCCHFSDSTTNAVNHPATRPLGHSKDTFERKREGHSQTDRHWVREREKERKKRKKAISSSIYLPFQLGIFFFRTLSSLVVVAVDGPSFGSSLRRQLRRKTEKIYSKIGMDQQQFLLGSGKEGAKSPQKICGMDKETWLGRGAKKTPKVNPQWHFGLLSFIVVRYVL